MSTITASYPPVARPEYLERCDVRGSQADVGLDLWNEVHEQVQDVLAQLDDRVRSDVPSLRVEWARTEGREFRLFSYRTFSRGDAADVDPVVAGLTFTVIDDGGQERVSVEADISGERTGDSIAAPLRRTVAAVRRELLSAARDLATRLCSQAPRIGEALRNPLRNT